MSGAPTRTGAFAEFRFDELELTHVLSALRARAASHPDNPGLIACWPAVPEHRMGAACRELACRGHPVHAVFVAGWQSQKVRGGWALSA